MVEVRLKQRADKTMYYEVLVSSQVRTNPQLKNKGILEFERGAEERTRQKLGMLAGALAEDLCEKYGDTLDPSDVANAVMEWFIDAKMGMPSAINTNTQDSV